MSSVSHLKQQAMTSLCVVVVQGLYLIQAELPTQVFNYMEAVLGQTLRFSTGATRNMTEIQVIE